MNEVYIVSARRTAIGNLNGQFSTFPAHVLGGLVIRACLTDAEVGSEDVDEVIMGQVLTAGQGQNPARQAALEGGIAYSVPAYGVNMLCGSGLKAICLGYQSILNRDASIVIAGGQESMSMAHHTVHMRGSVKFGNIDMKDSILSDGLTDAFKNVHMGNTAEYVAEKYNVSRDIQDRFAVLSQNRAEKAVSSDCFKEEILKIPHPTIAHKDIYKDEYVRFGTTLQKLEKLRPVFEPDFRKNPTVTAGNSSGINDGAAAVMLVDSTTVKSKSMRALARIVGFAQCGLEPMEMGLGPIEAIRKLLRKVDWKLEDVDLFELNEAFAAQSIVVVEKLCIDIDKVNVSGGAIALGHPIGCSGARILVTLIYNLKRLKKNKGIAALCIGGGMGIAIAIERKTSV